MFENRSWVIVPAGECRLHKLLSDVKGLTATVTDNSEEGQDDGPYVPGALYIFTKDGVIFTISAIGDINGMSDIGEAKKEAIKIATTVGLMHKQEK